VWFYGSPLITDERVMGKRIVWDIIDWKIDIVESAFK
jgi:hypothetical protein